MIATSPAAPSSASETSPGFGSDVNHVASKPATAPATKLDPWQLISNLIQQYHGVFRFFRTLRRGVGATTGVIRAAKRVQPVVQAVPGAQKAQSFFGRVWSFITQQKDRAVAFERGLKTDAVTRFNGTALGRGLKSADVEARQLAGRAGIAIDDGLDGTRLGEAIHLSGSGSRLVATMGGRMPIIGTLMSGIVGVIDVRRAIHTMEDPAATTRDRWIAGAQGAASGLSALFGMSALGVAALSAIGVALPISVPVLLLAGAASGAASFLISFFGRKPEPVAPAKAG
ncbi:MAG TPA: hypothetical protein V6D47_09595 [Oscillatoriaceae cyanobacterium]